MGSAEIATIQNYAFLESSWLVVDIFPDGYELLEATINLSEIPDDLVIEMETLFADVTFVSTGTQSMTVTSADFDDDGTFRYYLTRPKGQSKACHRRYYNQAGSEITRE